MKKNINLSWVLEFGLVLLLLLAGKFAWQTFGQQPVIDPVQMENSFQYWLWINRGPDLIVQIGLIFAGALGIAALLPGNKGKQND